MRYLPTLVDFNNWLKSIVSEGEIDVLTVALLVDDIVGLLIVVFEIGKSDFEGELKKFSKPGGGPMMDCLSILDDDDDDDG